MLETVQNYISWGSSEGELLPQCSHFASIFYGNKSWLSPFVYPSGFVSGPVEESCEILARNLTWHSGSLNPGDYIYPLYAPGNEKKLFRIGFVWTAIGQSSYFREVFGHKAYNYTIMTSMLVHNETAIIIGNDLFYPPANNTVPDDITKLIARFLSFLEGDCKRFQDLFWNDHCFVSQSGLKDEYWDSDGLTAYCERMMFEWSEYVYKVHHVTYTVSRYSPYIEDVVFTWTRTGVYRGKVTTNEILTDMGIMMGDGPVPEIKISAFYNYFEP